MWCPSSTPTPPPKRTPTNAIRAQRDLRQPLVLGAWSLEVGVCCCLAAIPIGNRINLVLWELLPVHKARQRCHLAANCTQGFSLKQLQHAFSFLCTRQTRTRICLGLSADFTLRQRDFYWTLSVIRVIFFSSVFFFFRLFLFCYFALIAKTFRLLFMAFIVLFIQLVMPFVSQNPASRRRLLTAQQPLQSRQLK